jgi:translation initiation factor 1A
MPRPNREHDNRRGAPIEYRLKMPQEGELIGIVVRIAGASKFNVRCADGNDRLCIIPGRLRRQFWIKENDVVIVRPWSIQGDERGDIVWRYSVMDMSKLRERGMLPG